MDALQKIKQWLLENEKDGVLLSRRDNYAWVTGGRRNQVVQNQESGTAALLITPHEDYLIADAIDAQRIFDEETGFPVIMMVRPWFDPQETFIASLIGVQKIVSDNGIAGTENVQDSLIDLRLALNPKEEAAYLVLGKKCAQLVEETCMEICPGWTENRAARLLQSKCVQAGISPDCVLAGSDERIDKYRHPMPTGNTINERFMLVLGGEQNGLNISLTRMVYFGDVPAEIRNKYECIQKIFAEMQEMTLEGTSYRDFFRNLQGLYAKAGYPGEWNRHHQGGPTGYACREKIITPDTQGKISVHQAFAWNPSITGAKCEETTLLTQDGIRILTRTDNWPVKEFQTKNGIITVADILVRQM